MPFDAVLEASRATALAAHSAAGLAASSGAREAARLLRSAEALARAATAALHASSGARAQRGVSTGRARGGVAPDAGRPDVPGAVPAATVPGPAPKPKRRSKKKKVEKEQVNMVIDAPVVFGPAPQPGPLSACAQVFVPASPSPSSSLPTPPDAATPAAPAPPRRALAAQSSRERSPRLRRQEENLDPGGDRVPGADDAVRAWRVAAEARLLEGGSLRQGE